MNFTDDSQVSVNITESFFFSFFFSVSQVIGHTVSTSLIIDLVDISSSKPLSAFHVLFCSCFVRNCNYAYPSTAIMISTTDLEVEAVKQKLK